MSQYDLDAGIMYFSKAYYEDPKTKRERQENSYFIKDWKFFINTWKYRGKTIKDFEIDFEDTLSEIYGEVKRKGKEKVEGGLSDYNEAIALLEKSIKSVILNKKPPHYEILDIYMRKNKQFNYKGAKLIEKLDGSGKFSSFSDFINKVYRTGKIKISSNGIYKEIYLKKMQL